VYFPPYIESWNFAKRQCERQWLTPPNPGCLSFALGSGCQLRALQPISVLREHLIAVHSGRQLSASRPFSDNGGPSLVIGRQLSAIRPISALGGLSLAIIDNGRQLHALRPLSIPGGLSFALENVCQLSALQPIGALREILIALYSGRQHSASRPISDDGSPQLAIDHQLSALRPIRALGGLSLAFINNGRQFDALPPLSGGLTRQHPTLPHRSIGHRLPAQRIATNQRPR
jgi:hypothetical protein